MPGCRACSHMYESLRMTGMNKARAGRGNYIAAFLLSLTLSTAVAAEDSSERAQDLINKMTQAARDLNYEGVFIYRYGQSMDTMRIIHKVSEEGERQRLVSLTGSAREVIRNDKSVTCIFPENRAVMVEKSRSRKLVFHLPRPIESVSRVYRFSTAGEDRIAGRKSWIVNISPRDKYRYGYKLWIDQDSYLLLKSELRGRQDNVLEQILFTQLDIRDNIPDDELQPSLTGKDYTWYKSDADRQVSNPDGGGRGWRVHWTPAGFDMQAHQFQHMPISTEPVEHIIYTDGIAIVSIFIERLERTESENLGASSMGGVNTYTRHKDGYQITAVGEVPLPTVEGMAKSVVADN